VYNICCSRDDDRTDGKEFDLDGETTRFFENLKGRILGKHFIEVFIKETGGNQKKSDETIDYHLSCCLLAGENTIARNFANVRMIKG
jgi:hypothetical protein